MNLVSIKQHLMQVKMASLSSLAIYFNADAELLRQMLGHWVRKGCVRQCLKTPMCGGSCMKCAPLVTEIYEWISV